jgi:hypothetical protein
MLRELAGYVEYRSDEDMEAFISSGYRPAPNTRAKTPPLSESIRRIKHGIRSGELQLRFVAVPDAHSYEVRWAPRLA